MPSAGKRTRKLRAQIERSNEGSTPQKADSASTYTVNLFDGIQITESISNHYDKVKGHYDSGGPFYTSRVEGFCEPAHASRIGWRNLEGKFIYYSGNCWPTFLDSGEMFRMGYEAKVGDKNESQLKAKGPTAISLTSPTNKTAELATNLGEIMRDGIPSLHGIRSWEKRTLDLKSVGDEYLNHQFGWAPLVSEVKNLGNAARHHRDILKQYHGGEGKNTHRRFDFPSSHSSERWVPGNGYALEGPGHPNYLAPNQPIAERVVTRVRESRCWFEACYTYGGPGNTDSFRRHLGYGSDADKLLGTALTPNTLWELTPWSWAVDWFSNAGEVINNATNFGLAGLVMRYGYMMEETIDEVSVEIPFTFFRTVLRESPLEYGVQKVGPARCGVKTITKRRVPASPFGFSVGWEDLSPTQLAITAALGITKWL